MKMKVKVLGAKLFAQLTKLLYLVKFIAWLWILWA